MAEAFARTLGGDILVAESAGLLPSDGISKYARLVMLEKNIPIRKRTPKLLSDFNLAKFDLVVNMTGRPLTFVHAGDVVEWDVSDPAGRKLTNHRAVRDRIEALVRNLVANLRFREGFAPRRDRAQYAMAVLRTFALLALLAGPAFSTPIYDEPASFDGLRTSHDLVSIGWAGSNAWVSWDIEPAPHGGYFYHYEFGGLNRAGFWVFYLESEPSDDVFLGFDADRWAVSFYSRGAPVWGNFVLLDGLRGAVFNAGWAQPYSRRTFDFIACPGDATPAETPEPSALIPIAIVLVCARRRRNYSGTAAIQ